MSRPERATRWLTDDRTGRVLALGVGAATTATLAGLGHEVVAAERDPDLLARCVDQGCVDQGCVADGGVVGVLVPAIGLPFVGASFDAVVTAPPSSRAAGPTLEEAARVLRPGGTLAVVHDRLDETIPWVRRLVESHPDPTAAGERPWLTTPLFTDHRTAAFGFWQESGADDLAELLVRRTGATPDTAHARALAVQHEHARGASTLRLRYRTECDRMTLAPTAAARRVRQDDDGGLLVDLG